MIAGIACSRSASGITTSEFLAPPSACTRLPLAAPPWAMIRAVSALPTKETASISGSSRIAVTASRLPWTRLTTPSRDRLDRVDDLGDQRRRPRVLLGGLEDEGVAAGDREGQEPERDHRREVERGDRGDDADRLAHQLDVDPGGDPLERLPLQQVRDRRRRLDRLDAPPDLAVGVGQGLAHVGGDQRRQLLAAGEQALAQRQQRPRPLLRRHRAPARLRRARGLGRGADLGRAAQRHQRRDLAGGRLDVVERPDPVDLGPGPADVVAEPLRRHRRAHR